MKLHLVLALAGVTAACASQPHRSTAANRRPVESSPRQEYADSKRELDDDLDNRAATDDAPRRSLDRQNANADGYLEPVHRPDEVEPGMADLREADPDRPSERAPDNTAHNKAASGEAEGPTPFDQGTSESDRKITQVIRKAVMADDSLSFNAKNIKIITRDRHVVLRGPVNNQKERAAVEVLANRVVSSDVRVDNQLQVK